MGKKEKKEKDKEKDKDKKEKKEKDKEDSGARHGKEEEAKKNGAKKKHDEEANREFDHRKMFKECQKFLTPPMADATRAFYESLLQERPESKIATRFCIEYGLLPLEEHKILLKRYIHMRDKGLFNQATMIRKALEKKASKDNKG